jgi:hypothetical protein
MRNSADIDSRHSRAIVKEIGERLRASIKEDRELPANFQKQIERLRQSENSDDKSQLHNLSRHRLGLRESP